MVEFSWRRTSSQNSNIFVRSCRILRISKKRKIEKILPVLRFSWVAKKYDELRSLSVNLNGSDVIGIIITLDFLKKTRKQKMWKWKISDLKYYLWIFTKVWRESKNVVFLSFWSKFAKFLVPFASETQLALNFPSHPKFQRWSFELFHS